MHTFQQVILRLQDYWDRQGCALLQPYDMEVGAGTSHTATFLRAIGPEPWRAAYVQPSRRPKDGRYGENPNRMQHYYQFQVVLKPSPTDILDLYLGSLEALGFDLKKNDVRFVEDDWENPTLGAWGLGWEVWLNGMEVTQFTYFQQVGGLDCHPITGEITYGLERLAMYLQGKENVFDLVWTEWDERGARRSLTYRDVFHQNEVEQSTYNFEQSNAPRMFELFTFFEGEAKRLLEAKLALPGYEMILKAAHTFNLLDARGAISVTERAAYIGRIRTLSRMVAQAYYDSREALGFPMLGAATERGVRSGMTTATLAVELLTEELPPKALKLLGEAFAEGILDGLRDRGFLQAASTATPYATPRRLAVKVTHVLAVSPDQPFTQKLMPASVALDADDRPTAALRKRLAGLGRGHLADLWPNAVDGHDRLASETDGKADAIFLYSVATGITLQSGLQAALDDTLARLPIPKVMTYQRDGVTVKFVRPAHRLLALHGAGIVPVTALGLAAGRVTDGHRFLGRRDIDVATADAYEETLAAEGKVIASFAERRARIVAALTRSAAGATVIMPDALLDEVNALVEWPAVYAGTFDPDFLAVPQECLILTMQQNQKYFALAERNGKLAHRFLLVSNIESPDPRAIVEGNERVLRARLADAKFFYDQDRKTPLEQRVGRLAHITYHRAIGSTYERVARLRGIATQLASWIGTDSDQAARAAWLCKADLVTDMVGEFPELQGLMGRYYAINDGDPAEVARAIGQHYWPRFAGDLLPEDGVAQAVALADKLDSLIGLFGIGEVPTGDRDPFGLRRAALGIVRILVEKKLRLSLPGASCSPPNGMNPPHRAGFGRRKWRSNAFRPVACPAVLLRARHGRSWRRAGFRFRISCMTGCGPTCVSAAMAPMPSPRSSTAGRNSSTISCRGSTPCGHSNHCPNPRRCRRPISASSTS